MTTDFTSLARALGATLVWVDPEALIVRRIEGEPLELEVGARLSAVMPKEVAAAIRGALAGSGEAIRARFGARSVTISVFDLDGPVLALRDTTEAEAELARANQFLDAIIENIPDMIFVKDAETLLFERFNRAGEELLGWSRGELIGKTDHDFYPKEQADFFHAKDRETLRNKVLVEVQEEPILTRAKGLRWLHTKKVPVIDDFGTPLYLLGISEDITARKEADERAHALERELASVIACVPAAVITWAAGGRIVSWNLGAERLYGIGSTDAIGTSIERIVPESERDVFRGAVALVEEGAMAPPLEVYRLRAGAEIEVEEQLFLLRDAKGDPSRVACVARDRSELQRLRRATEVLVAIPEDRPRSSSPLMAGVLDTAEMVAADPNATVLLLGETGVGKSWLARRVHQASPRVTKPFLEINCASLAPELVESELFGHEKGAFTGAQSDKRGLVEAADGGTLFLDEVGELPQQAQAHLLTFLDTQRFRRVGGMRALSADVRILAATNLDLERAIADGKFRKDLYYRLSVVPIRIPPLRERADELRAIAESMLDELAGRRGVRRPIVMTDPAIRALERYEWPGNLRELRNVLERTLILNRGGPVRVEHLPVELHKSHVPAPSNAKLDDMELAHIKRVLEKEGGNRSRAAQALGISRSTLRRKLSQESR